MTSSQASVVAVGLASASVVAYAGSLIVAGAIIASLAAFLLSKPSGPPVALDPKTKIRCKLIEREELTHDVRRFRFSLPDPASQLGLPIGKHVMLSAKIDGKLVVRPYTPVTANTDLGIFDLVLKVYFKDVNPRFPEGGKMSQYLNNLAIGDGVDVRGPTGHVEYLGNGKLVVADPANKKAAPQKRKAKKIGMVAGGTGITPMLQVIRHVLHDPADDTEMFLLFANQTPEDILLMEELLECDKSDQFHLWFTVDRSDDPNWKYSTGYIDDKMLEAHMPAPGPDTQICMCGPPPMIKFACMPNFEKLHYTEDMLIVC